MPLPQIKETQPWWRRVFRFSDDRAIQQQSQVRTVRVQVEPVGSSGVRNFSGYAQEEYLSDLTGYQAADKYDEMRRSDTQVRMVLSAVKNPIKSGNWFVEPGVENDGVAKKIADFVQHVFFNDMDKPWSKVLSEILTMLDFGNAPFEITHKVVLNDPKWGTYNGIRSMGWRSPRTIHRYNLDPETGKLKSISQYAFGDIGRTVEIPADFLVMFTWEKEGDNYEGISLLRSMYGSWLRKQEYLKIMAIGVERNAIPTVVGTVPAGAEKTPEFANFKAALQVLATHQSNYITLPAGDWKLDFIKGEFDPEKVQAAIDSEDRAMVKAALANFLELGMSTSGGSWALSFDLSDFFLMGLEQIAALICEEINTSLIPNLVRMNFGPQPVYPKMKCVGISDEGGKELAEALKTLAEGKIIVPDDPMEADIRRRFRLTKKSSLGQREVQPAPQPPALPPASPVQFSERIQLAEREARRQISEARDGLLAVMRGGLRESADALKAQIMGALTRATPAQRSKARAGLTLAGQATYKAALTDALAQVAGGALAQARRELPAKAGVQLSDGTRAIQLASRRHAFALEDLPKKMQDLIKKRAALLTDTQFADLEKAIFFQFDSSEGSTDSDALVGKDLEDAIEKYLEGPAVQAAAGNTAAYAVNEARAAFFFDSEVLDGIESFTFVNGDPKSEICSFLAGTTFRKDDPEAARYFPPLHHNCKSYIVANPVGLKSNPKVDPAGLKVPPSYDKYVTLHEGCDRC